MWIVFQLFSDFFKFVLLFIVYFIITLYIIHDLGEIYEMKSFMNYETNIIYYIQYMQ